MILKIIGKNNWKKSKEKRKENKIIIRMMIQVHQVICLKILLIRWKRNLLDSKTSLVKSNQMNSYKKWLIHKCYKITLSKWKETRKRLSCKWLKMKMESLRNIVLLYHNNQILIQHTHLQSKSQVNKICRQKFKFIVWDNKRKIITEEIKVDLAMINLRKLMMRKRKNWYLQPKSLSLLMIWPKTYLDHLRKTVKKPRN